MVKLLVKKLDVNDAPKLSLSDIQNDRENELVIARDDFAEEEMRLFLHASNFRRMRKAASAKDHCPVISMVGPTGAGKSSIIKRLNPIKPPVVAFQEQQIPTTSNVNSFYSAGFNGVSPLRILDLEGDDGGLPLMEYCKNYQHLSSTDYLSADDVSTFVKQVFQHYDEKELTAYMNKRKHVTKHLLPRLCYIMSDVIVYVNTVPAKRESMYLDRVLEFVEKSQTGVSSAELPSLILVYNQCPKRQKPFDIAEATDHFFVFVDREKKLLESYRTVDFVKIPDWENESLYAQQVTALQKTIAARVLEQKELKRANGTLFSEQVWFDILDKVVENFLAEENISMSRIFGKFIISESSLVNRAYAFFHHVYGASTKKAAFLCAREQSIKMLAAHIVFRAIEKGHGELRDVDDNWVKLLSNLLQRIRRRSPCEAMHGSSQQCTEELQTHGAYHRFGGTKKRAGHHQFADAQSDKDLEQVFRDAILSFQKNAALGGAAGLKAVHQERLGVFRAAITPESTAPQKQCALCFRNRADCLLSSENAFCVACIDGLKADDAAALSCPLTGKPVHIIENVGKLPGRYGIRILCLEGGGVRGPVLIKSLRRLEHAAGMPIGDMFDIVCGTGVGGVVACAVGSGKLSLDQCEELFHSMSESVFQKPRMGHRIFNIGFLQSIFGKPYNATSFNQVLQAHLGDDTFLDGARGGAPRSPKVFALAGATAPQFEPYILGNYPPGKRDKPTVACLYKLWEVCRATMSTPKFFAPFQKAGTLLVDGAVFANNPAEIAIAEANIIWNFPDIDLVVSVGCGLTGARDPGADNDDGADDDGAAAASEGGADADDDAGAAAAGAGKKDSKRKSSSSSSSTTTPTKKELSKRKAAAAKAQLAGPKGDCKFTFGQEVVDLAESGESVHNNMRQVLNENEKYVRLEPRLSKPSAASTDAKQLRQMAAEAEAWVNENDHRFMVARQRLLAKGLYIDGAGAFSCVVGTTASFEVRRKQGLAASVDIPIFVELRNDTNEVVPTTVTPLDGVPGARRVTFKIAARGVYSCNVYAQPSLPAAPAVVEPSEDLLERMDVSGSPFLIQAELASGAPPLPSSIEFIDFIKGMPLSVFPGASDETSGAHQQRLDARLKALGLKVAPVPLDADCQFYAVAEQLFRRGAERAPFIRSMATWWLRLNGDFVLANNTRLDEQVPEGTWDSYVDHIEDGGWGDHVSLVSISEVFGTAIRVVSSVEGDTFVTEYQPRVLKRTRVVLLSLFCEFCYGSLKATSKSKLRPT